jgi:spore maturation protein CgeB
MGVMRVLVCHPGATVSTSDVFDGVVAGLSAAGAEVITFSLHGRVQAADNMLHAAWRAQRRKDKSYPRPTFADVVYQSTIGIYEKLYRFEPDVVLFISGVLVVAEVFRLIRKRHVVGVLLTESPYLMDQEQRIAGHADVVWTNERSALAALQQAQPQTAYLPHAWLPGVHDAAQLPVMPAHDVVFVGTDFKERIDLLEAVDWNGIDLGLYGNWQSLRPESPLTPFVRGGNITNAHAAALYRQAKIGLNLYRTTTDFSGRPLTHPVESLNPRAYELAACGVFSLSTPRAEVTEKFGTLVPTFSTATELQALLRQWLADDAGRSAVAAQLPACVAEDTWLARGRQLLANLQQLRARAA